MKIKLAGLLTLFGLALTATALVGTASARHVILDGHVVLMPSATENRDLSEVTLPLYRGTSHGQDVFYVVTDASTQAAADLYGANYAPKLGHVHTSDTQVVTMSSGSIDFPHTVDFSPKFFIDRGDYGDCSAVPFLPFGRKCFSPGAQGEDGYTPLVTLPSGAVLNAPQIANDSGRGDKVIEMHIHHHDLVGTVVYDETTGLYEEHTIHYMSFDASIPPAAALEGSTLAPRLNDVGTPGESDTDPAGPTTIRASLAGFTNGQIHKHNPNRQGINSAILDRTDPLNVIQAIPDEEGRDIYSPLWDIHLATWRDSVPVNQRTRQDDFMVILANPGDRWTAPDGTPFRASNFVVTCPVVSTDGPGVFNLPD